MPYSRKIYFRLFFIIVVAIIFINVISNYVYFRIDLTRYHRYTFSEVTEEALHRLDQELFIEVLLEGSLPPKYKRLQEETRQVLQEFTSISSRVIFNFINPLKKEDEDSQVFKSLVGMGVMPSTVIIREGANVSRRVLFPWALVNYKGRTIRVPLMKNTPGLSDDEKINISIQQLEYVFSTAIQKLLTDKKKTIAILKGNAELKDLYIADFLKGLKESYAIAPFTLDSVERQPQKTLDQLSTYDLAILAKPTAPFSDKEQQILDQYIMRGGRMLMLIDEVNADLDSLLRLKRSFAFPRHLNLEDMLFRYGVRINPVLVKDLSYTDLVLAQGNGTSSTYRPVPWLYAPLVVSQGNHLINKNIKPLKFSFANTIDTIANDIKKTILLHSSAHSRVMNVPRQILLQYVLQQSHKDKYNDSHLPLAVLLEGRFTSVYKHRIKPFKLDKHIEYSTPSKLIVVADGDIVANQVSEGAPLELGFDKWTHTFYGNKDFLINCVNYLLDDTGLISVRTKKINVPLLDKVRLYQERDWWQFLNLSVPLLSVVAFGVVYTLVRRRKYLR